eukprot:contig_13440_g3219
MSRSTGLLRDAGLVFIGKKKSGDYHGETNSATWLKRLEDKVLPRICGGVLVVDRALYHLARTEDTRPARANFRKAEFVAWLEKHAAVPEDCGHTWRRAKTVAQMRLQAAKNRPAPRYLVQDLAARFEVSILISPVAHPELNPIEMVWGTVKMAAKRGNVDFHVTPLKALVEAEFEKITAYVWARYEDNEVGVEEYYRSVDEISAEVEEAFKGEQDEDEEDAGIERESSDEE